ncbi:NADH dehydrogenase ubiquinone complex I [Perilla frutescens var. frutescens]|nr:NADH dehydrogenase ubiquinone complex I [Perilla frutescens var. frutescens]
MLRRAVLQASTRRRRLFSPSPSPSPSYSLSARKCSSSPSSQIPHSHSVEQSEDTLQLPPSATVSIDRSNLYHPPEHSHEPSDDSELVKLLKNVIKMVGVWAVCLWEQMGQPDRINLVELGPGRGTLMADLLRGVSKFKNFTASLQLHLVECSPALQKLQYQNLKCTREDAADGDCISMLSGSPVSWHAMLEQVPTGVPTIIIAHEFYDALPVHQFQKASRGWCEKMVDVTENSLFRFVLSPQPTPATLYLAQRCKWAKAEEIAKVNQIEVCPKAIDLTQEIANRIAVDGGGALIIDYGLNGIVSDSLQAIRKHKFVDILDDPGSADLSAYVDFEAIRRSAEEIPDVTVHGPITQSQFLGSLGINFRVEALLENCSEEQADALRTGYWRLVGEGEAPFWEGPDEQTPIGMGTRYLAMAIVNEKQGVPAPYQE